MFGSFQEFKAAVDCPQTHWAIDVYTPPHEEYLKVHNWACQLEGTRGYSLGPVSSLARQAFRDSLLTPTDKDSELAVFIVPTGTAANALARLAVLDHNKSVILCSEMSHQADREAGSVESLTGSRALKPADIFSKPELRNSTLLDINKLYEGLLDREDKYLNQKPWMISLSYPLENGQIPSDEYVRKVANFCHNYNMLFHMDGARLFVAAGALGKSIRELTIDAGVDIFSLGGSKVGMIGVDAVVFTPSFFKKYPLLHHYENATKGFDAFRSVLKRIGCLSGRSEEGAAQFARAMTDGFGESVGQIAYRNAIKLEAGIKEISGVKLDLPVQTNVVCVKISNLGYDNIFKVSYPYNKVMRKDEDGIVVRFQASHATKQQHIDQAVAILTKIGDECPL